MSHTRKEVKIRKPHQCHGCGIMGSIGDHMESNSGVSSEAGRYSYYLCLDCAPVAKNYWGKIERDDCFEFGAVRDWMEHFGVSTQVDLIAAFDAERVKFKLKMDAMLEKRHPAT